MYVDAVFRPTRSAPEGEPKLGASGACSSCEDENMDELVEEDEVEDEEDVEVGDINEDMEEENRRRRG